MIDRTLTRRRMISIVSTGAVVGMAGCGALQEEDSGETNEDETANDEDSEMGKDDNITNNETGENEASDEDDDVEIREVEGYGRGANEGSSEEDS